MKRGVHYAGLAGAVWGLVLMVPQVLPAFSPWLLSAVRFTLYGRFPCCWRCRWPPSEGQAAGKIC
jgi:hypothetical protein